MIIQTLKGHTNVIYSLAWSPNSTLLASGGEDNTIRLWDPLTGYAVHVLEGHTAPVICVAFSANGALLASKANDGIRLWRTDTWETVSTFSESATDYWPPGLAFHPTLPRLATLGKEDTIIRIWDLDMKTLLGQATTDSVRYTTAKLVLVGDSGVGKTGLGWRLAHGEFKDHPSTHGQQFWVIDDLGITREDGTECEAILWDLAGQQNYRPIHAIFLDDVALALVLFDPTNRQRPLKGVEFWLKQLQGKQQLPPSVLVGARVDRGAPVLAQQELAQFCQRYGISAGYISTSAKTGEGLSNLLEKLQAQIPWDAMPATVTTRTFKRIKEYVLSLKESLQRGKDRERIIVHPADLRAQLKATDPDWHFTDAEMMTAVKHLENHGYVAILHSSEGEESILLAPDLLVDLASSIVLQAGKDPHELGALNEQRLLHNGYDFEELAGLTEDEQELLIDAAVVRFLEHDICFRETLGNDTLLIFPGFIKQKRPLVEEIETMEDVSYIARGAVENTYAALVVLLGYTNAFTRINQWQNQAQYALGEGEICGFRQIEEREGEIELILYYGTTTPTYAREMFRGLFEKFLYQRNVEVTRFPPLVCANGHVQERAVVVKRLQESKDFLFCAECGEKITLPDIEEPIAGSTSGASTIHWLAREEALVRLRRKYEQYLARVKSFRRDRATPRCYVSHYGGDANQDAQAAKLINDLRDAGVYFLEDCAQVTSDDIILVIDSPTYRRAFQRRKATLKEDIKLIKRHLECPQDQRATILPVMIEGKGNPQAIELSNETNYAVGLFDLVLKFYAIPRTHPAFAPLREDLVQRWQRTLKGHAGAPPNGVMLMHKIRAALLQCGPFESVASLYAVFTDPRLKPWRDQVPSATSSKSRVDALIDLLHDQSNTDGDNALALFLHVLSEYFDSQDACREKLLRLAKALDQAQAQKGNR